MSAIDLVPSHPSWALLAVANLPTLLIDHAHCERKAADTALKWMQRYPDHLVMQNELSRLAREELVHFERVQKELKARGIVFGSLPSAGYAGALFAAVKNESRRDVRSRDEMLVCALIEARSHERFECLMAAPIDAPLRDFYASLADAEARHGELYLELAASFHEDGLAKKLAELTAIEAAIIHRPDQPIRMHAGYAA